MLHRVGSDEITCRVSRKNKHADKTGDAAQRGDSECDRAALMRAPTVPGEKETEGENGSGKRQRGGIDTGGRNRERKIARR